MAVQQNSTKQRMLPHNIESEQCVLGCVLIDQNAAMNILSELKKDDFYEEPHKIIFDSMYTIYCSNTPVDYVTLIAELEKRNMLDSVGGVEYITTLTNIVPSSSNYKHYQDIVKDNSVLRKLITASNEIINTSFSGVDQKEALSFAEKSILDISANEDRSTLTHIKNGVYEVMDKLQEAQKNKGVVKGVETGLYGLDKITNGLQKSDLILVAARPAVGKTSLALNICTHAAVYGKKKVAIFSLEMPKSQLALRALCGVAMVNMSKALKGELSVNELKALWGASEKLENSVMMIDDSSLNTPMDILSKCRRMKAEYGLDLIMIDYLQLMSSGGRAKDNRQQEISEMSRSLKILAKELDVPVILLSQLSRAVETRKDHIPILSDLRESGAIEQDADIVIFIHRPDTYNDLQGAKDTAQIIIAKHRNGATGSFECKFIPELTAFVNSSKDSEAKSLEETIPPEPKDLEPMSTEIELEGDDLSDIL